MNVVIAGHRIQEEEGVGDEDMLVAEEYEEETGGQGVGDGRNEKNGRSWEADDEDAALEDEMMGLDGELGGQHDEVEVGERDGTEQSVGDDRASPMQASGMLEEETEAEEEEESDADELVMSLRQRDVSRQRPRTRQRVSASNTDEFLDATDKR